MKINVKKDDSIVHNRKGNNKNIKLKVCVDGLHMEQVSQLRHFR